MRDKYLESGDYHWKNYYGDKATAYQAHVDIVVKFFKDKKGKLLDIGCGDGLILSRLNKNKDLGCFGIDVSPTAISIAKDKGVSNCAILDLFNLTEADKYDCIFMGDVLEHLPDYEEGLRKAKKCLKADGLILVTVPLQKKMNIYDLHLFTRESIFNLIKKVFKMISFSEGYDKIYFVASKNTREIPAEMLDVNTLDTEICINSLLDYSRLNNLYSVISYLRTKNIEGSFVECGVMNGGSAGLMALFGKDRQTWLFDSWDGLPEPSKYDVKFGGPKGKKGTDKGSEEKVRELIFSRLKLEKERIYLIKGWFKDTLPCHVEDIGKIAFLHLDCDWYESVKLCLESLYSSVVDNGIIVVDDYMDWMGCSRAVDEFIEKESADIRLINAGRVLDIQKKVDKNGR